MNEIHLLNVLKNEELLKYNILSNKEKEIYNLPLNIMEVQDLEKDLNKNIKKFEEVSKETLKKVSDIKIRSKRLYNTLSDEEYSTFVKNNSYNVKDITSQDLCDITELWLEGAAGLFSNTLHLCFDTESCETPESFKRTLDFTNTYFPGFDIYNPNGEILRAYNEKMHEIGFLKEVKVYSWSLGSVGSPIQLHGETLKEFEDSLKIILSCLKPHKRTKNKKVIGMGVSVMIDVHNLAWDLEFLKYYFHNNGITHWYPKTEIDKKRSYIKLGKNEETGAIEGVTHEIKKQKNESQPENTYSVVIGKNQVYECKWELEPMETQVFSRKKGIERLSLKRGIHFYDMVKKVPMPLSEVAKLLIIDNHFKKGDGYDYKKIRQDGERLAPREVEYQYNDVYIMTKYLEQIYYNRNLKGTTASAIAFNSLLDFRYKDLEGDKYKKGFLEHFPTLTHCFENSVIRQFYRDMYNGGFTMGVKQLEGEGIEGIIIALDINSAYPYQMKHGLLPYGTPYHGYGKIDLNNPLLKGRNIYMQRVHYDGYIRKGPGINNNREGYGFIQLGDSLESSELNTKRDFKLDGHIYTARERPHTNEIDGINEPLLVDFESYWDQETHDFMIKTHDFWHYKRIKCFDKYGRMFEEITDEIVPGVEYIDYVAFYSEVGYFGEFIDEYIARKQIGKMLDNEGLTYTSKNSMNSCSGKLGSSYIRENIDVKEKSNGLLGYEKPQFHREYEANKEYYVPYIAFVTSYTRLKIMKIIYSLESEFGFAAYPFQACDTDSVYIKLPYAFNTNTVRKVIDYIKTLDIKIDPIELGAWDVEKVIFRYKNLGSKKMMMDYIELKNVELDKDIKEYLKEYDNNDLPLDSNGDMILKTKVTCAGLPDATRIEIAECGFGFFDRDIDYVKQIKDRCIGGYILDYGVHNIKNTLFN